MVNDITFCSLNVVKSPFWALWFESCITVFIHQVASLSHSKQPGNCRPLLSPPAFCLYLNGLGNDRKVGYRIAGVLPKRWAHFFYQLVCCKLYKHSSKYFKYCGASWSLGFLHLDYLVLKHCEDLNKLAQVKLQPVVEDASFPHSWISKWSCINIFSTPWIQYVCTFQRKNLGRK